MITLAMMNSYRHMHEFLMLFQRSLVGLAST